MYQYKDELKKCLPQYLGSMGIDIGSNGRGRFTCFNPAGHQHGDLHPSAHLNKEQTAVLCDVCRGAGMTWDIFRLIGINENLPDFKSQYSRACQLYGFVDDSAGGAREHKPVPVRKSQPAPQPEQPPEDLTEYFKKCQDSILQEGNPGRAYLEGRGFSLNTIKRAGIGYDSDYHDLKNAATHWKCIVIPTGKGNCVMRNIESNEQGKKCRVRPARGKRALFGSGAIRSNSTEPIYLCEGELDALAIRQAGGQAVATGGSGESAIVGMIQASQTKRAYIVMMDRDSAGEKHSKDLLHDLQRAGVYAIPSMFGAGVPVEAAAPFTSGKDFNDIMQAAQRAGNTDKLGAMLGQECTAARNMAAQTVPLDRPDESGTDSLVVHQSKEPAKPEYPKALKRVSALTYSTTEAERDTADYMRYKERKTGFENLDEKIGALRPGLYAFAAASSLGKTTYFVQLSDQLAEAGHHVLYFTLEQRIHELWAKSISRLSYEFKDKGQAVTQVQIQEGATGAAIRAAKQAYQERIAPHLDYIPAPFGATYRNVIDTARQVAAEDGGEPPIIFIDYLQILAPENPRQDIRQQVDEAMHAFKVYQMQDNATILLISNINRANYATPISLEAMKESGGIDFTCDFVFGLQFKCLNEDLFKADGKLSAKRDRIREARSQQPREVELVCLKGRGVKPDFSCYFLYNSRYNLFTIDEDGEKEYSDGEQAADRGRAAYTSKKETAAERRQRVLDMQKQQASQPPTVQESPLFGLDVPL